MSLPPLIYHRSPNGDEQAAAIIIHKSRHKPIKRLTPQSFDPKRHNRDVLQDVSPKMRKQRK